MSYKKVIINIMFLIPLMCASVVYAGAVRPGFDSNILARNDDGSTGLTSVGFDLNFYGVQRNAMYINNNGNVTFDSRLSTYTPFNIISAGREIIAPFFGDVDTRRAGSPVTYGSGTVNGYPAFGVNWVNVDCYSSSSSREVRNSFQLVLIERAETGPGNFDIEFNYDSIEWEAGQASSGDFNCLGGNAARAGYSNGTTEAYELPGSGVNGAFLDTGPSATSLIQNRLNSDVLGRYVFTARDGEVIIPLSANAGPDQAVDEGSLVQLDGTGTQPDDVSVFWEQIAGTSVLLSDPGSITTDFVAPNVSVNETLTFQLLVFNNNSPEFDSDTVDILVINLNSPPISDAGDDASIREGEELTLNGGFSSDPDSDVLTYFWTQIFGTPVILSDDTAVDPSFTAPFAPDTLQFQLTVFDSSEYNDADADPDDIVTIDITENNAPVANAGPDTVVNEGLGVVVQLSGLGSSDPDGDGLTYEWIQVSGPTVALDDYASATPSFEPGPVTGSQDYVFQLSVTDDYDFNSKTSAVVDNGTQDDSVVTIRVADVNAPPSCDLAYPSKDMLWPPNHKLITIDVEGVLPQDDPYPDVVLIVTGVTQDEPIDGTGDGDTSPDAIREVGNSPADSVLIRSERSGKGNGRVYEISFGASDGFESCTGSVFVEVPHSRKKSAVDDGQNYSSHE